LPDVVSQTFSGVSIVYRESFDYVNKNEVLRFWRSDQEQAILVTRKNQFQVKPLESSIGTVFYYSGDIITPDKGVYLTFKYTGAAETFTLGIDNVDVSGQRVFGTEFRSVATSIRNQNAIVYGNFGGATAKGSFDGTLTLQEDTWYSFVLAYDENQNYIVKSWQPDNPEKQLTYTRTWQDFPDRYNFISWISSKCSLLIDDFAIFRFDKIIQE